MKVSANKRYAVLTGDVVDSSKLSAARRKALPKILAKAGRETQKAFSKAVPLEVDVFRGDSWQLLVAAPLESLRVALFLRARLRATAERGKGLDTRISVAIGRVDFVPGERVSQGDGEAYRASGRGLDALRRREFLKIGLPEGVPGAAGVQAAVRLIDVIAQGWTGPQAQAVSGALLGWPQDRIAEAWPEPVRQSTVSRHLEKAAWEPLAEGLAFVEAELERLVG